MDEKKINANDPESFADTNGLPQMIAESDEGVDELNLDELLEDA